MRGLGWDNVKLTHAHIRYHAAGSVVICVDAPNKWSVLTPLINVQYSRHPYVVSIVIYLESQINSIMKYVEVLVNGQ